MTRRRPIDGAAIRRWLRLRPRTPQDIAEQVEDEIALHIELRTRELVLRGIAEDAARAEAELRFGALQRTRIALQHAATRRERRMSKREWLSSWVQDIRYSARSLGREPLQALVIVLTLALGLGANAIMFGVVDQLLLRGPAHVADPDALQRLYLTQQQRGRGLMTSSAMGYVGYAALREGARSFDGMAAYMVWPARLGRGASARELAAAWSTASLFEVLGVEPAVGRFYGEAEDRPYAAARVAVLDYGFWQSEYGGARDALGRTIVLSDVEYTIIGVAPPGFTGPDLRQVNAWLPLSAAPPVHPQWTTSWTIRWLDVIARVRPGVAAGMAAEEATSIFRAAAEGNNPAAAQATLSLLPLRYGPGGREPAEAAVSRWLLGVSAVVLLVAAANVMNLLLARVLRRRREVAVRLALGISRARLVRLLLTESLLLALVGLAGALAVTAWGGRAVRLALLPDVQWGAPLGGRTLLFALAAALLTGLLIGLLPALQSHRHDLNAALRTAAADAGLRGRRLRGALTVLQTAFSVVLLVGAGLFVRSLWNVSRLDLGIEPDRVLGVWAELESRPDDVDRSAEERESLRRAVEGLAAHPGVEHAALALGTPLQGGLVLDLRVPGHDTLPALPGGGPYITAAAPGYFETVGTRIVRGRSFEPGEGAGTEAVAIVNETMARTLWPGEDALTKCLIVGGADAPCARVVGIAQDAHRRGIREDAVMQYYVPLGQEPEIYGTQILVRPRGDAVAFIPELRRALHEIEPGIPYFRIDPLQRTLQPELRPWRLGATMFLIFGGLALLIAAVGLYSVIAYGVARRRKEIGVRIALGARTRTIVGMILRHGVGLVSIGMLAGTALALLAAPRLEPLLFETSGRDAVVLAGVVAVLGMVAVVASIIPALRAGRTDPLDALRAD